MWLDLINFLRLSRPHHIVILLMAFALGSFYASGHQWDFLAKNDFRAMEICLALMLATGYWVNDVFDFKKDRKQPGYHSPVNTSLSTKKVLSVAGVVNAGVIIYSFFSLGTLVAFINIGIITLLFLYSFWLKDKTSVGGIWLAAMSCGIIYYAGLLYTPVWEHLWIALLCFFWVLGREWLRDLGNLKIGLRQRVESLPYQWGIKNTKKLLFLCFGVTFPLLYAPLGYAIYENTFLPILYLIFATAFCTAPQIYLLYRLRMASEQADFIFIKNGVTFVMIAGLICGFLF